MLRAVNQAGSQWIENEQPNRPASERTNGPLRQAGLPAHGSSCLASGLPGKIPVAIDGSRS